MAQMMMDGILIGEVETKDIMTKSSLPVGGYSVNPYVGCTHACKYCYACFMKTYGGMGQFPGCEALAGDQKSAEIRRAAGGDRLCHRRL